MSNPVVGSVADAPWNIPWNVVSVAAAAVADAAALATLVVTEAIVLATPQIIMTAPDAGAP